MSDLIRREGVIATIGVMYERCDTYDITDYRDLMLEAVKVLPSVDRPQGEWIKHEHGFWTFVNDRGERDGWLPDYECNLCGSRAWRYATNFCPNCGCRMKGADDE